MTSHAIDNNHSSTPDDYIFVDDRMVRPQQQQRRSDDIAKVLNGRHPIGKQEQDGCFETSPKFEEVRRSIIKRRQLFNTDLFETTKLHSPNKTKLTRGSSRLVEIRARQQKQALLLRQLTEQHNEKRPPKENKEIKTKGSSSTTTTSQNFSLPPSSCSLASASSSAETMKTIPRHPHCRQERYQHEQTIRTASQSPPTIPMRKSSLTV